MALSLEHLDGALREMPQRELRSTRLPRRSVNRGGAARTLALKASRGGGGVPMGIEVEFPKALRSVSLAARRHPLMLFFALAFAFSWVVWAPAVLLSRGSSAPQTSAFCHLAGSLGPMVSAFVVTTLAGSSTAIRELLGRVFRWKIG